MAVLSTLATLATTKVLVAVIAAIVVVIVGKIVLGIVAKQTKKMNMDPTLDKFLQAVSKVLVWFVAIMIVAGSLGFEMSSLVALASVVSAAFALAASGVLSNIFGGMLLLITKPFQVGDYIAVNGEEGSVQELGILATKINTLDNKRITMPNSAIAGATIVNYSKEGKRRVDIDFKVGYENDPDRVKAAILATAAAHELVIEKENSFARVSAYNECTVTYTMRVWCKTADYWTVYFDMMEQVKANFDKVGIKMVYPYLNVRMEQESK